MKKYIVLLMFLMAVLNAAAQTYPLMIPGFNNRVEISGLAKKGDFMYFPSEKSPLIYKVKGLDAPEILHINFVDGQVEIEGIAFLNNQLFVVSENFPGIYVVDEVTKKAKKLKTGSFNFLPFHANVGDGLEGIASKGSNMLYILQERTIQNGEAHAIIYTFKFKDIHSDLELMATDSIELPGVEWRYTDLFFDAESNKLMCLKSKYGSYEIETIDVDPAGKLKLASLKPLGLKTELNEIHRKYCAQNFSTNFEGFIKDGNTVYMVTDNYHGSAKSTGHVYKTLYIKLNLHN